MGSVEKTGKTVDDAIKEALKALNTTIEKVEVTILEHGSRGILGIGSKPARILATAKFDAEQIAKDFLRETLGLMGLEVSVETKMIDRQLYINLEGEEIGILIGKRGQTLDSLQYIVNLVVNKGNAPYVNIILDTENYRQRRKETLESLAFNLAKKAKQTKVEVVLEPMSAYERRIIHSSLQSNKFVETLSRGEEPYRYIVIMPKA